MQEIKRFESPLVQFLVAWQSLGHPLNLSPILGLQVYGDLVVNHVHRDDAAQASLDKSVGWVAQHPLSHADHTSRLRVEAEASGRGALYAGEDSLDEWGMIGEKGSHSSEPLGRHRRQITAGPGQCRERGQCPLVLVVESLDAWGLLLFLLEDASLQHFLHILSTQCQSGVETGTDLAEAGLQRLHIANDLVQPGLGGDNEP